MNPAERFTGPGAWREGLRYGALGLPLAFVALPLYVLLPHLYARDFGAPLAALGTVLLFARLADAFIDPWIGRVCDRWFARSHRTVLGAAGLAAVALALGLWGLLIPPPVLRNDPVPLLAWAGALLALTYAAYSTISVAHQSWGVRLGGNERQRSRIQAWREGLALAGVLLASVLPGVAGLGATVLVFAALLATCWVLWTTSVEPPLASTGADTAGHNSVWGQSDFVRLLAVFVVNGTASAMPATLVLFFVQDRLQAPPSLEPAFLATYFLAAALSLPLWVRLVPRLGLANTWLAGMLLSVAVFAWTLTLGAGDHIAFLLVCAASGIALGTDLALPGALLSGLLDRLGVRGQRAGTYLGWWNFATKLNLALAAGLALPALELLGYTPGTRDATALQTLSLAYAALPCALKLLAAGMLHALVIRAPVRTEPSPARHEVLP